MKSSSIKSIFGWVLAASLLFICFCSCDSSLTYRIAGENAAELRSVVRHYSNEGNPQKARAAKFLVRNMALHWSYPETVEKEYCDSILCALALDASAAKSRVSALTKEFSPVLTKEYDAESVSSDYLVRNIDDAFERWRTSPFLSHLDFKQFCNIILPYRCIDGQRPDDWKRENDLSLDPQFHKMLRIDELSRDVYLAATAANDILKEKIGMIPRKSVNLDLVTIPDADYLKKVPIGNCREKSILGAMNCLSCGIPVTIDYTPAWGDRSGSHMWNCAICSRRHDIDFFPFVTKHNERHYGNITISKVYRVTYAANRQWLKALRSGYPLPMSENGVYSEDVTKSYARTSSLSVKIGARTHSRYLYLAVPSNDGWAPVDVGRNMLGHVRFRNVGKGVLYSILDMKNGARICVGAPFFLDCNGEKHYFREDGIVEDLHITRKHPAFSHIYRIKDLLGEAYVEISSNPDFSDAVQLCTIPDSSLLSGEVETDTSVTFRYARLRAVSADAESHFSELFFYGAYGSLLSPEGMTGPSGMLLDRDLLSNCAVREGNGQQEACFDFKEKTSLKKIAYIRRGDGNDICPGEEYELYIWQNGGWRLFGAETAHDIYLDWPGVPSGCLCYLKCLTSGHSGRPFSVKDGRIRWY